jgi:hypothetical protein
MRKDSFIIFGASVVVSAAIVGGAYYMTIVQPAKATYQPPRPAAAAPAATGVGNSGAAATRPPRTGTPIWCYDEEVGEFWTNARRCEDADLGNRLSHAQTFRPVAGQSPAPSRKTPRKLAQAQSQKQKQPNLRGVARAVPDGLPVSCKFPIGRALEVERALSASKDPAKSPWRENYCKWINEAESEGCRMKPGFYYYGHLCPHNWSAPN